MELMVVCLALDTDWIEGKQLEVADDWTHLIGGLVCDAGHHLVYFKEL